jgi:small neutral amino acid transporter SnatA (MarC family)
LQQPDYEEAMMLDPSVIFTAFFVTLGPLKTLAPFAQRTRDLPAATVRQIAWWSFVVATIGGVAGGLVGRSMLTKWDVSVPALRLSGGIIFFLVALSQLLEQYRPPRAAVPPEPLPPSALAAGCRLVFPIVLTPYGIAGVIALLAQSEGTQGTLTILGVLVFVMCLDLIAMLFARFILRGIVIIILQVLGAVLAVLQVALALEVMVDALRSLRVLAG